MRARYERAARIQAAERDRWLPNASIFPHWISPTRFWYRQENASGHRRVVVDAAARSKTELVDEPPKLDARVSLSPDGKRVAFVREYDIWVRDLGSLEERRLTADGEEHYAYALPPGARRGAKSAAAILWSPDSRKLLTHQVDERQVKDLPMIEFAPANGAIRPRAFSIRAALPGDPHIPVFRMTVIDVDSGRQVEARYPSLAAIRMLDTPVSGGRAWWGKDAQRAYFVDVERGEKRAHVVELDTVSGRARVLFSESRDDGYLELGSNVYTPVLLRPLPATHELIWYSERSGWGHLYLYDLATGKLERQLTRGEWLVRDVIGVDATRRDLFISIAGRDANMDPYYRQIAKVSLDSARLTLLSSDDADHDVRNLSDPEVREQVLRYGEQAAALGGLSPDGRFYVETVSRPDKPPKTTLRDRRGAAVMVIENSDGSRLPDYFRWPQPLRLTAADGVTPISALVFRPSDFSAQKRYPIVDHIYGGPQISFVPESAVHKSAIDAASLAELGFIVVIVDGRGTAERSRSFHEASYGAVQNASNLEDHIAAIKQLAVRYPYIDLDRVGVFGFSAGGYMAARAMLAFPDFFKVGVAASGNHDQRLFWSTWGERYQGLVAGDNYRAQASSNHAAALKGKLLFIHGLMDGVHPGGLFQLTQALIDANKDFDVVILPRGSHALPGYALRRQWDYFVRHLAAGAPPADFRVRSYDDYRLDEARASGE